MPRRQDGVGVDSQEPANLQVFPAVGKSRLPFFEIRRQPPLGAIFVNAPEMGARYIQVGLDQERYVRV